MSGKVLQRVDWRMILIVLGLMGVSLMVISSHSAGGLHDGGSVFCPLFKAQLKWFLMGWLVYGLCTLFDYNRLREFVWVGYICVLFMLVGVFFTGSIAQVHRWYRLPIIGVNLQPSEPAKLVVVMTLAWFLERRKTSARSLTTALFSAVIVGIPFLLILKQPDLGSSLVLFPITLVMFYFGDIHPFVVRGMCVMGCMILVVAGALLTGAVDHEEARPYFTRVIKEYQYERLNPNTTHQRASAMAIAVGGVKGAGWGKGEYTGRGWLPYPYTDSVFPSFGEEFGLVGLGLLLSLFFALIYFGFQVAIQAKEDFGRLLAAGITVYLAMHILVNIGMMVGFLPITGVPLVLVTYGGSSILITMASLGILQSIYSRRFMF